MKKYLILLACVLAFSAVSAQEEMVVIEKDTIKVTETDASRREDSLAVTKSSVFLDGTLNSPVFFWQERSMNPHWGGLSFAFANLDGLEGSDFGLEQVDLKLSQSYSFKLNFAQVNKKLTDHWVLGTGMGLDFTRYHFAGNTGLNGLREDNITQFEPAPDDLTYKSSKLLAYYITIPLILEYQTKVFKNKCFYINGGVESLIKYYSKSQVDIRTLEGTKKTSLGRDLNMHPINIRFIAQIGLGDVGIFGYYQPFSMFEKGKGPNVQPFGIGITIN
ncbi:MAG: outer membrane beta-barrel protein [Candidatus Symbiothrix sp.]|jgi:hypothetical protein|nr:outer membrane beta-barrel protein [Candidatus Symbiothrix sp.]